MKSCSRKFFGRNINPQDLEVPNALEVQPLQVHVTYVEFRDSIQKLSQVLENENGQQNVVLLDVTITSRIWVVDESSKIHKVKYNLGSIELYGRNVIF